MTRNRLKKKVITIPISGDVDISDFLPLVEDPIFQRLRFVSELGPVNLVFPGAMHTRFEHSLGVFHLQTIENDRWMKEGFDNKEQLDALAVFALLHDIGHPAVSHVTEHLLGKSNDDRGNEIIEKLKDKIERCGVSYEIVKSFFDRSNPLGSAVYDKNLGTDKLDYLERDSFHANFGGRPEINRLFSYIYWLENKLVLDVKSIQEAMHLQRFYMLMYKQLYLRKACLIGQRLIQKAVNELINTGWEKERLWNMTDSDLELELRLAKNQNILDLFELWKKRNLPKVFMVLRASGKEEEDSFPEKSIKIFGVPENYLQKIVQNDNAQNLAITEEKIGKILGIKSTDVLIVPSQGGFRFAPKDINLLEGTQIFSMKARHPEYFSSLEEESRGYLAIKICAVGNREEFVKHAEEIRDLILNS